jgi:hypothetical protein
MTTKKKPRKRRKCPSCGGGFHIGHVVHRVLPSGVVRQTVCKRCITLAIPVLATDAPALCECCSRNLAVVCKGCITSSMQKLSGLNIAAELFRGRTSKVKL